MARMRSVGVAVLILLILVGFILPGSVFAVTTINDYVVYGVNGVKVGGASVVNGLVGAQFGDPSFPQDSAVFLNAGAAINGDVRSGTNVNLQNNCAINGTLYITNGMSIVKGSGSSITATNFGNPDLPVFPAASVYSAGTSNISQNTSLTLTAGSYSNLSFSGGTLTLTSGTYFVASLTLSGTASVNLNTTGGPINIFATGNVNVDGRDALVTGANAINWEIHGNWTQNGGAMGWAGTLFVPNGKATIGSGSGNADFTGRVWANSVDIQHGVTVMVPEPSSIALALIGLTGLVVMVRRRQRHGA